MWVLFQIAATLSVSMLVVGYLAVPAEPPDTLLQSRSLHRLGASVAVPTYDRSRLQRSIVHIGVGGFHRSHLATYIHELCQSGHRDWSITGAGVLPSDQAMADALKPQDHLYTLITRGPHSTEVEVIGSIVDFIHASPRADRLVASIADPATQIVSLTITEGGYPVDDITGDYLSTLPTAGPTSAFGILAAGLQQRYLNGHSGLTVISCDNILSNGSVTRTATLGEANLLSNGFANWIANSVAFPNSMVDRITPATTNSDRAWLAEHKGIKDNWPVVAEPFRQWVVEDSFAAGRPPLEQLDVLTTTDAKPYELMKLRLLNAGHSCLAYLAALKGIETIGAALTRPEFHDFTLNFLAREARPVLPPIAGIDLDQYMASIVARFSNTSIGDQISRLCLDGSAKFPKFLLPTIRAQLEAGGPISLSTLALAGWCEYLAGPSERLAPDPMLDLAVNHARRAQHNPAAFLDFPEVFGDDLPRSQRFSDAFAQALRSLRERGVQSTIDTALKEVGDLGDRPVD